MKQTRWVEADGERLGYLFEAKRVKNFNLRVRRDGSVSVSAPLYAAMKDVDAFVLSHAAFIRSARARLAACAESSHDLKEGDTVFYRGRPYLLCVEKGDPCLTWETGKMRLTHPAQTPLQEILYAELAKAFYPVLLEVCREREAFFTDLGAAPVREIRLKRMKSMWGNCRKESGILTFSTMLLAVSPSLLDYVVCHEYCHLLHPNHGKAFYALLACLRPDYTACKRALRERKFDYNLKG